MALPDRDIGTRMKPILLILTCLFITTSAWGNLDLSLDEIESLIRLRDYSEAVNRLKPLADKGEPEALYRLAGLYRSGRGVGRNLEKATELYHAAAMAGHADAQFALALLIEKSNDSPSSRGEARRWYQKSAVQGHQRAAKKLGQFQDLPELTDRVISREDIFNAIRHNDEILINALLASGANLDLNDRHGNSTVMAALRAGWPHLAVSLIDNTRQFDQPNSLGNRPLTVASAKGYKNIVSILLDKKVDIDQSDARGDSALMLAIKNKNIEIAELLLKRGADHSLVNKKGKSVADLAYAGDNPAGRALVASYGIIKPVAEARKPVTSDLEAFKKSVRQHGERYAGWPLLNISIELGDHSITQQLIEQEPDFAATDPEGNSALHVAARKGDYASLRQLVSHGANVNATNDRNESGLYLAAEAGSLKSVNLLLQKRADPSIKTKLEVTPLEIAVETRRLKIAEALLKAKKSYPGVHRVLLQAIEKNMERLSYVLIKRDSELGSLDDQGRTALWHSASNGLLRTTENLLASGKFDLNRADVNGYSALAQAIKNGHEKVTRLLVKWGADLTMQTQEGNTLLMLAILSEKSEIVGLLLQRYVDVNTQNTVGDTALMMAAATGQDRVIEMLIKAGADMQLRNMEELNAYQIAQNAGHQDAAEFIREKSNFVFKLFN